MKHTENIARFDKADNGGVTLKKQYYYCLAYCYLHRVHKRRGEKNEEAMRIAGYSCKTNCTALYDAELIHISLSFGAPFVRFARERDMPEPIRFLLPKADDIDSCKIGEKSKRGEKLCKNTYANDYAIIDNGTNAIGIFRSSGTFSLNPHYYVYNFQHGTLDKVTCHQEGGQEYLDSSFQDDKPLRLTTLHFSDESVLNPEDKSILSKLQVYHDATTAHQKLFNQAYVNSMECTKAIEKHAKMIGVVPNELGWT